MASEAAVAAMELLRRAASDADDPDEPEAGQKEIFSSWALLILIVLLILALFTSYILQSRKIQIMHETVMSIFAGMIVGIILRITAVSSVLEAVSFDYQFFFNLLLPPIILASGYELHQSNFFRNIGTILTFAFAGTFLSAVILGLILWLWTRLQLEGLNITFLDAMSVGATLSATDPVTILAIFNTYKVDPKLYTVIFGESILNDAIAIVLFETFTKQKVKGNSGMSVLKFFESIGLFIGVFFGSLAIGLIVGAMTALGLKYTRVRRFPRIESCLVILVAYACYFFSNVIHMSGIVSLLFCGICLKHYAYHNMSRRTQLTTKFVFQIMAQLSENFIFIYLGLSLFTETALEYKPIFILVTVVGICVARYVAVFPLSKVINMIIRYRARRRGREAAEELPWPYQAMLFWAGLRGAVGVALAAGLTGPNSAALRATVLVVVVLTVIIFGGTTARMLEILNIRTGVVEEIDSDDEFDIEVVSGGGTWTRSSGKGFGHDPHRPYSNGMALDPLDVDVPSEHIRSGGGTYSSSHINGSPLTRPGSGHLDRRSSSKGGRNKQRERTPDAAEQGLLSPGSSGGEEEELDLPPPARRSPAPTGTPSSFDRTDSEAAPYPTSGTRSDNAANNGSSGEPQLTATGAIRELFKGGPEDVGTWFSHIDEGFIKKKLLLDPEGANRSHGASPGPSSDREQE